MKARIFLVLSIFFVACSNVKITDESTIVNSRLFSNDSTYVVFECQHNTYWDLTRSFYYLMKTKDSTKNLLKGEFPMYVIPGNAVIYKPISWNEDNSLNVIINAMRTEMETLEDWEELTEFRGMKIHSIYKDNKKY